MDRLEAFLRTELAAHPRDLAQHAARELSLPLSEVESAISRLITSAVIAERRGAGDRELMWKPVFQGDVAPTLQEDEVWRKHVSPLLEGARPNVQSLLQYCFTEMFNNVLDHSGAKRVVVVLRHLPTRCSASIRKVIRAWSSVP